MKRHPSNSIRSAFGPTVAILVAATLVACSESTSPPRPSSVAPDAATATEGTAGTVLSPAPSIVVKDQNGNILGGVPITVTVTSGGGTLANPATTTVAGGPTSLGQFTLGQVAGPNVLTVTVGDLTPLVISIAGKAGPPVSMVFIFGANVTALAGATLSPQPVVQVRDQFGNGVPGIAVTFSVVDGEGSAGFAAVTTNASGNATAPQWRLGKTAIPQALRATAGALTATAFAVIQTDYNIDLRFVGPPMPLAAQDAFIRAAARIRGSVVGDLPSVSAGAGQDLAGCGLPGTVLSGIIDDIVIYASVQPIDGPGRVLARGGPCFIRDPGRQTIVGSMTFDSEDIQPLIDNGRFRDVVTHEMFHIVGIGTLWPTFGVIAGAGTAETRFTGSLGVAACVAMGGAAACPGSIPVENTGGAGTADGHWRESVFDTEMMTGFVDATNPLSIMSIQSLADLGYATNQSAADSYAIPGLSARGSGDIPDSPPLWETVEKPKFFMTNGGRLTPVPKR